MTETPTGTTLETPVASIDATYHSFPIQEFNENPLISALNIPAQNDKEAYIALGQKPYFHESELDMSDIYRSMMTTRLTRFFSPSEIHVRTLYGITTQVFTGYLGRNPISASGQSVLYGSSVASQMARPSISFVVGQSGMGKSTLLTRILNALAPQLIRHKQFGNIPFPEMQVVHLRRNLPEKCTVKNFCAKFGSYADTLLGTEIYQTRFERLKRPNQTDYLNEIRRIIANHHIGALVIDEFQNLTLKGSSPGEVISLLINLRDELGLPIIIIGTYKALKLLNPDLSIARRLADGGFFEIERPLSYEDENWISLCKRAWNYQWVRKPIEIDESIFEKLYDYSQGITGIMLTLLVQAQQAAMYDKTETVDANSIEKTFETRLKQLTPALNALKSADPMLMDTFEDLYQNIFPTVALEPIELPLNFTDKQNQDKKVDETSSIDASKSKSNKTATKPVQDNLNNIDDLMNLLKSSNIDGLGDVLNLKP